MKQALIVWVAHIAVLVATRTDGDGDTEIVKRESDVETITQELDALKDQISAIQFKHGSTHAKAVTNQVDGLKQSIKEGVDSGKVQEIAGAVTTVIENMQKLQSNDPLEVVDGVLQSIGSVADLLGPAGTVISGVLSVVTGIIGLVNEQPSVTDILVKAINDAISEQTNQQIMLELKGQVLSIQRAQDQLNALRNISFTEHDFQNLMKIVKPEQGEDALNRAHSYLEAESKIYTKIAAENTIRVANAVCQLSVLRELMLIGLYNMFTQTDLTKGTELMIWSAITTARRFEVTSLTLFRQPTTEQTGIAALYLPEQYPIIEKRITQLNLPERRPVEVSSGRCAYLYNKNKFACTAGKNKDSMTLVKGDATRWGNDCKMMFHHMEGDYWIMQSQRDSRYGFYWGMQRWHDYVYIDPTCPQQYPHNPNKYCQRMQEKYPRPTLTLVDRGYLLHFRIVQLSGQDVYISARGLDDNPLRQGKWVGHNRWAVKANKPWSEDIGNVIWQFHLVSC